MKQSLFLVLILSGCIPYRTPMPPPKTVLIFHVDTDFRGDRRRWLEEAAYRLEQNTMGRLRIEYRYDLTGFQRFPMTDWYLVDLPEETELARHFDEMHETRVIGECDSENHIVYLSRERVSSHDRFVHTAMHEILHAIGVPHVKGDPSAIMAGLVLPRLPLSMSDADLRAFHATLDAHTPKEIDP